MLQAGRSVTDESRAFKCTRATKNCLLTRYRITGTARDRSRVDRPRATSAADDRHIDLTHLRRCFQPAIVTARAYRVTGQTIRNRLRNNARPIQARRVYFCQILMQRHRNASVLWCQRHPRFSCADWCNIVFTDEFRFNVSHADRRARVFRRKGERYANVCVQEVDRFGCGSVFVWSRITHDAKTRLVVLQVNINADRYIHEILEPEATPFLRLRWNQAILMQDNARPQTAIVTRDFLGQNAVNVLPWATNSPDLNPIEHKWDEFRRRVCWYDITTVAVLSAALVREWNALDDAFIRSYVWSIRRCLTQCINANVGHTRYWCCYTAHSLTKLFEWSPFVTSRVSIWFVTFTFTLLKFVFGCFTLMLWINSEKHYHLIE